MSEERFYSVEEVAEMLQVDKQTVRRWIKLKRLSAYKPGLEWRIHESDLAEFLEGRSFPKAPALPLQTPSPSEDLSKYRELLAEAGTRTNHLGLPEEDFVTLWEGKPAEDRAQINQEVLEERRLVKPLVTRWASMPASSERSQLYRIYTEIHLPRLLTAAAKNAEAAELEAEIAQQEGDEVRAREIREEAQEFAGVAS